MRRDPTVGRLLTRSFAVLVALIVSSGVAETTAVLMQHRVVRELSTHVQPLELANARLRAVLGDAQRGLRGYLLTGDGQVLDTYHVARSEYTLAGLHLRDLANAREDVAVDAQLARADIWWSLAEQQRRAPPRSDAAARYVTEGKPLFPGVRGGQRGLRRLPGRPRRPPCSARSSWRAGPRFVVLIVLTLVAAATAGGDRAGDRPSDHPAARRRGDDAGRARRRPARRPGRHRPRADRDPGRSPPPSTPWPTRATGSGPPRATSPGCAARSASSATGSGPTCGSATRSTRRSGGWPPSCGPSTCWSGWRRGRPTCRT
ncbi:CHASE3 domain-containing protein [Actinoplanes nipponensis]|uniref:CHASE3 domain-containing protein n=1 Tax=Actinoplanes nipponensis TaxID=135950 RepID=UPI0031EBE1A6